ncbi:POLD1 [Symbiodinium sp. CCMP2456]|nr:POLD1 [Symbiodinium sp. CCMP2456]
MAARRSNGFGPLLLFAAACWLVDLWVSSTLPHDLALVIAEDPPQNVELPQHEDAGFFTKVFAAAAQGCTAALVAAVLSAMCEPLVNRLLVKRMTVSEAWEEMTLSLVATYFFTTFPTNMLKFPVFEVINRAMTFTDLSPGVSGLISGWLFCTIMLPVTNYRFRKSMGWEIKTSLLYQAYIPTVARDIMYGWARGMSGDWLQDTIAPVTFTHKAMVFGLTIWVSCIISSPCNEWRGYTLQLPERKLPFNIYFRPINYARSTGIGSCIMGIALMFGMLVTPYAEEVFTHMKEHAAIALSIVAVLVMAIVISFDMLTVIQKEQKLSSYSLNAVSAEFLGEQKEDVHHSMIGDLFLGSAESRRRLAVYCLKDAYLPMRLMDKLLCMYNYVEMARVTGTPINFLLNRGQMIKVQSQLLRKAGQCGFVMPTQKTEAADGKFDGATVLEPRTGFYPQPIATLDFASLYPSIMMAHNLCYCTLLKPEQVRDLQSEEYTKTPNGCYFLKSSRRRGLLPMILEELLAARKRAKKAMAEATDPLTKSVLNGRQLALKISANSVYGFTGATVGVLPCLDISSSVTSFGRTMIDHTKQMVQENFCIEKGYAHDAEVIYGDTDSVMVKFGVDDVAEAMRLGQEAADLVSATFAKPIKLEFEKVYCPYLLMNKKRYAGLYWTNPDKYDKLDAKGIETVRRDNCGLARHLVDMSLRTILIDKSVPKAIELVQKAVSDLLQNKIDLSLLVITKSLGKGAHAEDYSAKQAHVELAERMRKRDPTTAPGSGDRVPYVICAGAKNAKAYERSEDPLFALENNKSIDANYYIEHQLQLPLLRIFGPIMGNDDKAQSLLFNGDHTRKVHAPTQEGGALSKFITKSLRCKGCKAVIKQGMLCEHCAKEKAAEVVVGQMKDFQEKEQEYNRLWTQCQRCQGSLLEPVICSNRDCDIFYRRAKARKDVQLAQEQLSRLKLDW